MANTFLNIDRVQSSFAKRSVMKSKSPISGKYKYGFHKEENYVFKSERGLDADGVRNISRHKDEPSWMLDRRLMAYLIYTKKTSYVGSGSFHHQV